MRHWFPFLAWFPLTRASLKADALAAIAVALVLVPQSMAYAQLAGMPAYYGLYAALLPVAVGALWGSSPQLATGPVAVVSLLTASSLATLAAPGSERFIALAVMLAFLVGAVQFVLGVFKLGVVVSFLSHPVIVGFTNAAALIIGLSQLNKLLGVPMTRSEHFAADIWGVLRRLDETHLPTLLMGLGALALMWALKKHRPQWPGVLIAVLVATVLSWASGFALAGGQVVGAIPPGLPGFELPQVDMSVLPSMLALALVISLVGFMEAISIAKAISAKTRQRVDPNQELIGQGLANLAGSVSNSFPVSGSFSRSAVNLSAGAQTGMSSVFAAALVLATLLFLTPLLYHLPQAVLAAIIIMAVAGLFNFRAMQHAWQAGRDDGIAAVTTFAATLAFAPHLDKGVLLGAGLAVALFLYRSMKPRVAILGRHADGTLRDVEVHPGLRTSSRVAVIRFDGSLYFANVAYFEDVILQAEAEHPEASHILVVGDGINRLDASGAEAIRHLAQQLRENGVTLMFSGLKRQVLEVMRRTGLVEVVGEANLFATADQALKALCALLEEAEVDALLRPLCEGAQSDALPAGKTPDR